MTTQETIRTLKMEMLGDSEQMKYAKQIAIEALEKQIPKKPTAHKVDVPKIKVGNGFFGKGTTVYRCPCCNELISRICDCCYKCGQAIDWSEVKKCDCKMARGGKIMHKFKKLVSKKVDGKNYYSILYFDETDGEIHQGFSSGSLDVISDFLKEFFINNNTERHAHRKRPAYFGEKNGVIQRPKEEFVIFCGSPKENKYNYCPTCGAKMDEVVSDDT